MLKIYCCPNCWGTVITWDKALRKAVCPKDATPASEYKLHIKGSVKELKKRQILVKYGPLDDSDKYCVDLLNFFKQEEFNGSYPFEETNFEIIQYLSSIPYTQTDRAKMPDHYQCMGSVSIYFINPDGNMSPFSFVDFQHTEKKHYHHNPYVYWRKFDGSCKNCYSKNIPGHDQINVTSDVNVSLVLDDAKVFNGIILGKKRNDLDETTDH